MKRIPTLATLAGIAAMFATTSAQTRPMNVLFIAVDDLRPELGCFGHPVVKSPHIDRLAATGAAFTRAYCNIAVCGASRASIMSGVRPGVKRFVGHDCYLDQHLPGAVSLPMHFRNNGYRTISLGKVFHHQNDSKGSWDVNWRPRSDNGSSWRDYLLPENLALDVSDNGRGMPYEKADVPDEAYFDGKIALKAIDEMRLAASGNKPFFLAVGFLKPHLPFNAPSRYWDLYNQEDIHLPENREKPAGAPDVSMHTFGELRAYAAIPPSGQVPDSLALKMIHGYYACVSYTDAQIGKLLEELERLGISENTMVVLWGDHGYHLAEKGLWCKHCNYEKVLRVPLIIRAPGYKKGVVSGHLTELVDVYPTLCDLAGLVKPFQLQGNSLVPLLNGENPSWKDAVYARWVKGETIITRDRTYTAWLNDPSDPPFARMMYNYANDREETVNVSELSGYSSEVKDLHNKLIRHLQERERVVLP